MSKKAAIIKGDGVGPELVDAMIAVTRAAGTNVEFIPCEAVNGNEAVSRYDWVKPDLVLMDLLMP